MKKVLSVLVAAVMLAAICVPAFAATPAVTMTTDKTDAAIGDTVTVTVSVAALTGLEATVKFNDAFELVDAKATSTMTAVVNKEVAGEVKLAAAAADEANGAIATVTLKYLGGEGVITLDVADAIDVDDATVEAVLGASVATATITEAEPPVDDPIDDPADEPTEEPTEKPTEKPTEAEKTTVKPTDKATTTDHPKMGGSSVSVAASAAAVVVMAAAVAYTMKKKDEE